VANGNPLFLKDLLKSVLSQPIPRNKHAITDVSSGANKSEDGDPPSPNHTPNAAGSWVKGSKDDGHNNHHSKGERRTLAHHPSSGGSAQEFFDSLASRLTITTSIQQIMTSRLDRLSPTQQEILKLAAVIGVEFGFALLSKVCAISYTNEEIEDALHHFERFGFILTRGGEPDTVGRFRHTAMQEVAYTLLSSVDRDAYHLRIAQCIEEEQIKAEMSWIRKNPVISLGAMLPPPPLAPNASPMLRPRKFSDMDDQKGSHHHHHHHGGNGSTMTGGGHNGITAGGRTLEETMSSASQIAHHYHMAGEILRAIAYYNLAAEAAWALNDVAEGLTYMTKLIQLACSPVELVGSENRGWTSSDSGASARGENPTSPHGALSPSGGLATTVAATGVSWAANVTNGTNNINGHMANGAISTGRTTPIATYHGPHPSSHNVLATNGSSAAHAMNGLREGEARATFLCDALSLAKWERKLGQAHLTSVNKGSVAYSHLRAALVHLRITLPSVERLDVKQLNSEEAEFHLRTGHSDPQFDTEYWTEVAANLKLLAECSRHAKNPLLSVFLAIASVVAADRVGSKEYLTKAGGYGTILSGALLLGQLELAKQYYEAGKSLLIRLQDETEETIARTEEVGRLLNSMANVDVAFGRWADARLNLEFAYSIHLRNESSQMLGSISLLALMLRLGGNYDKSTALFQRLQGIAAEQGSQRFLSRSTVGFCENLALGGRFQESLREMGEKHRRSPIEIDLEVSIRTKACQALAHWGLGNHATAQRLALEGIHMVTATLHLTIQLLEAIAAINQILSLSYLEFMRLPKKLRPKPRMLSSTSAFTGGSTVIGSSSDGNVPIVPINHGSSAMVVGGAQTLIVRRTGGAGPSSHGHLQAGSAAAAGTEGDERPDFDSIQDGYHKALHVMAQVVANLPVARPRMLIWRGVFYYAAIGPTMKCMDLWDEALTLGQQYGLPYEQGLALYWLSHVGPAIQTGCAAFFSCCAADANTVAEWRAARRDEGAALLKSCHISLITIDPNWRGNSANGGKGDAHHALPAELVRRDSHSGLYFSHKDSVGDDDDDGMIREEEDEDGTGRRSTGGDNKEDTGVIPFSSPRERQALEDKSYMNHGGNGGRASVLGSTSGFMRIHSGHAHHHSIGSGSSMPAAEDPYNPPMSPPNRNNAAFLATAHASSPERKYMLPPAAQNGSFSGTSGNTNAGTTAMAASSGTMTVAQSSPHGTTTTLIAGSGSPAGGQQAPTMNRRGSIRLVTAAPAAGPMLGSIRGGTGDRPKTPTLDDALLDDSPETAHRAKQRNDGSIGEWMESSTDLSAPMIGSARSAAFLARRRSGRRINNNVIRLPQLAKMDTVESLLGIDAASTFKAPDGRPLLSTPGVLMGPGGTPLVEVKDSRGKTQLVTHSSTSNNNSGVGSGTVISNALPNNIPKSNRRSLATIGNLLTGPDGALAALKTKGRGTLGALANDIVPIPSDHKGSKLLVVPPTNNNDVNNNNMADTPSPVPGSEGKGQQPDVLDLKASEDNTNSTGGYLLDVPSPLPGPSGGMFSRPPPSSDDISTSLDKEQYERFFNLLPKQILFHLLCSRLEYSATSSHLAHHGSAPFSLSASQRDEFEGAVLGVHYPLSEQLGSLSDHPRLLTPFLDIVMTQAAMFDGRMLSVNHECMLLLWERSSHDTLLSACRSAEACAFSIAVKLHSYYAREKDAEGKTKCPFALKFVVAAGQVVSLQSSGIQASPRAFTVYGTPVQDALYVTPVVKKKAKKPRRMGSVVANGTGVEGAVSTITEDDEDGETDEPTPTDDAVNAKLGLGGGGPNGHHNHGNGGHHGHHERHSSHGNNLGVISPHGSPTSVHHMHEPSRSVSPFLGVDSPTPSTNSLHSPIDPQSPTSPVAISPSSPAGLIQPGLSQRLLRGAVEYCGAAMALVEVGAEGSEMSVRRMAVRLRGAVKMVRAVNRLKGLVGKSGSNPSTPEKQGPRVTPVGSPAIQAASTALAASAASGAAAALRSPKPVARVLSESFAQSPAGLSSSSSSPNTVLAVLNSGSSHNGVDGPMSQLSKLPMRNTSVLFRLSQYGAASMLIKDALQLYIPRLHSPEVVKLDGLHTVTLARFTLTNATSIAAASQFESVLLALRSTLSLFPASHASFTPRGNAIEATIVHASPAKMVRLCLILISSIQIIPDIQCSIGMGTGTCVVRVLAPLIDNIWLVIGDAYERAKHALDMARSDESHHSNRKFKFSGARSGSVDMTHEPVWGSVTKSTNGSGPNASLKSGDGEADRLHGSSSSGSSSHDSAASIVASTHGAHQRSHCIVIDQETHQQTIEMVSCKPYIGLPRAGVIPSNNNNSKSIKLMDRKLQSVDHDDTPGEQPTASVTAVSYYRMIGIRDSSKHRETRLCGRFRPLFILESKLPAHVPSSVWKRLDTGQGQLVIVSGNDGGGKTALLDIFARSAEHRMHQEVTSSFSFRTPPQPGAATTSSLSSNSSSSSAKKPPLPSSVVLPNIAASPSAAALNAAAIAAGATVVRSSVFCVSLAKADQLIPWLTIRSILRQILEAECKYDSAFESSGIAWISAKVNESQPRLYPFLYLLNAMMPPTFRFPLPVSSSTSVLPDATINADDLNASHRADVTAKLLVLLLAVFFEKRRFVLVIQNGDFMDSASASAVRSVCASISSCMIVISTRPLTIDDETSGFLKVFERLNYQLLKLDALTLDETRSMVMTSLGTMDVPHTFVQTVHEKTKGHPRYIVDIMQVLRKRGFYREDATRSMLTFDRVAVRAHIKLGFKAPMPGMNSVGATSVLPPSPTNASAANRVLPHMSTGLPRIGGPLPGMGAMSSIGGLGGLGGMGGNSKNNTDMNASFDKDDVVGGLKAVTSAQQVLLAIAGAIGRKFTAAALQAIHPGNPDVPILEFKSTIRDESSLMVASPLAVLGPVKEGKSESKTPSKPSTPGPAHGFLGAGPGMMAQLHAAATAATSSNSSGGDGALISLTSIRNDLQLLVQLELLEELGDNVKDKEYLFAQDSLKDMVYSRIAPSWRPRLHARIATFYEAQYIAQSESKDLAQAVVDEAFLAHQFGWSKNASKHMQFTLAAARKSAAHNANQEALDQFNEVVELYTSLVAPDNSDVDESTRKHLLHAFKLSDIHFEISAVCRNLGMYHRSNESLQIVLSSLGFRISLEEEPALDGDDFRHKLERLRAQRSARGIIRAPSLVTSARGSRHDNEETRKLKLAVRALGKLAQNCLRTGDTPLGFYCAVNAVDMAERAYAHTSHPFLSRGYALLSIYSRVHEQDEAATTFMTRAGEELLRTPKISPISRATLCYYQCMQYVGTGHLDQALRLLQDIKQNIPGFNGSHKSHRDVMYSLAVLLFLMGRMKLCYDTLKELLEMARQHQDSDIECDVLSLRGWLSLIEGGNKRAMSIIRDARALGRRTERRSVLTYTLLSIATQRKFTDPHGNQTGDVPHGVDPDSAHHFMHLRGVSLGGVRNINDGSHNGHGNGHHSHHGHHHHGNGLNNAMHSEPPKLVNPRTALEQCIHAQRYVEEVIGSYEKKQSQVWYGVLPHLALVDYYTELLSNLSGLNLGRTEVRALRRGSTARDSVISSPVIVETKPDKDKKEMEMFKVLQAAALLRLRMVVDSLRTFARRYPFAMCVVEMVDGILAMQKFRALDATTHWLKALTLATDHDLLHYRALLHYLLGVHARVHDPSRRHHLISARAIFVTHNSHHYTRLVQQALGQLAYFDLNPGMRMRIGPFTAFTSHLSHLHAQKLAFYQLALAGAARGGATSNGLNGISVPSLVTSTSNGGDQQSSGHGSGGSHGGSGAMSRNPSRRQLKRGKSADLRNEFKEQLDKLKDEIKALEGRVDGTSSAANTTRAGGLPSAHLAVSSPGRSAASSAPNTFGSPTRLTQVNNIIINPSSPPALTVTTGSPHHNHNGHNNTNTPTASSSNGSHGRAQSYANLLSMRTAPPTNLVLGGRSVSDGITDPPNAPR
jgi:predicted ATPase/uncharacterized membrane protein YgcG